MSAEQFYVTFRIANQTFAVKLEEVYRIVRIVHVTPVPEAPPVIEGIINVQGEVIPVVNLRKRFQMNLRDLSLDDQILLVNANNRVLGLLVDEVTDIIESDLSEIVNQESILPGANRIEGVMKNAEDMIMIQDIDALLSADEEIKLDQSLKKKQKSRKQTSRIR